MESNQKSAYTYTLRFGLFGAVFGLVMAVMATLIAANPPDGELVSSALGQVLSREPLLWFIYLDAVVLAVAAGLAGRYLDREIGSGRSLRRQRDQLRRKVSSNTTNLEKAIRVCRMFGESRDLEELLNRAVIHIHDAYSLVGVQAYLIDARGYHLILASSSVHLSQLASVGLRKIPLSHGTVVGAAAVDGLNVAATAHANGQIFGEEIASGTELTQLAIPMRAGGEIIGVLNLVDETFGRLTAANVPAFEVIAGQLAAAIENARLAALADQARNDLLSQALTRIRQDWLDYLNAIDRGESIASSFEMDTFAPLDPDRSQSLNVPIAISGEPIGSIQLDDFEGKEWTDEEIALAREIGALVADQVEYIRLLAQVDRYREEAEEASRRMTKQGWLAFLDSEDRRFRAFEYRRGEIEAVPGDEARADDDETKVQQPITIQGEKIGAVELDLGHEADEETRELVAAVTDQLGDHLERLRLEDQSYQALLRDQNQIKRLVALNELAEALALTRTEPDLLQATSDGIGKLLRAEQVEIALMDDSAEQLEVFSRSGSARVALIEGLVPVRDSRFSEAIQENRVIITNEASLVSGLLPNEGRALDEQSVMIAPMRTRGIGLGALRVSCAGRNAYSEEDAAYLRQISSLVAGAIESKRLAAETERSARDLALINQVGQAVSQQLELDKLLETVYQQIDEAMHPDAFYIGLFNPETQLVDYPIMVESGMRSRQYGLRLYPESSSYRVIHTGKPVLSNLSEEQVAAYEDQLPASFNGEKHDLVPSSLIYVPLRIGQRVSGVLSIQSFTYNAYQEDDVALLDGIASYVAIAIDNARLFAQVQSSARREQILREVTARVRKTDDVDEVVETAAQEISRALGRRTFVHLDRMENDEPFEQPEESADGRG